MARSRGQTFAKDPNFVRPHWIWGGEIGLQRVAFATIFRPMAKAGKPRRKKRRRSPPPKKKGGLLMGMRSGFKNVAHSVAGVGEEEQKKAQSRRTKVLSTAVTVLLVAAAAAMLYRRFF